MNPYATLPEQAFWRTAVATRSPFEIGPLWRPKWPIVKATRIATFGSCFARHFGRAARTRGQAWVDGEPAPAPLSPQQRADFGYEVFSARTGNILTPRQLRQWLGWACSVSNPPDEFWSVNGRHVDPFRPSIEPGGFTSLAEARAARRTTVSSILRALEVTDLLIYTLGLTEAWASRRHGCEYAMAPGAVSPPLQTGDHRFVSYRFHEVLDDLEACIELLKSIRPGMKVIVTVAPGPLIATMSGSHVLVATAECKAILRAAAGEVGRRAECDYFPSYEVMTSPPFRAMYFAPNLRDPSDTGVAHIMSMFFDACGDNTPLSALVRADEPAVDPACDELAIDIAIPRP